MGDIVNLKSVRKKLARDDRARIADENRVKHGRTKAEKQHAKLEAKRAETALDAHKIET